MRRVVASVVCAVLASIGVCAATPAAAAMSVHACYSLSETSTSFTGWCDGAGPASYWVSISCQSKASAYTVNGNHRWYGDRRGSTATCGNGAYVGSSWYSS